MLPWSTSCATIAHMSSKRTAIILVSILVISLGLATASYTIGKKAHNAEMTTTVDSATSTDSSSSPITITSSNGASGYKVKVISSSVQTAPTHPQIDRPLAFASTVTNDQKTAFQDAANKLQAMLKNDPTSGALWINLGTVRKMAGDYEGAKEAWEYVAAAAPNNTGALSNLADLYANFLKDNAKAESYYEKVISLAPQSTDAYKDLATIYATMNTSVANNRAEEILAQGIDANPRAFDLRLILARLYRQEGDMTDAKLEYSYAANSASAQGREDAAKAIKQEATGL